LTSGSASGAVRPPASRARHHRRSWSPARSYPCRAAQPGSPGRTDAARPLLSEHIFNLIHHSEAEVEVAANQPYVAALERLTAEAGLPLVVDRACAAGGRFRYR